MTISNEEAAARMIELLGNCPLLRDANQEFWGGRDPDVPRWMSYALNLMLLDGLSTGERVLVRLVRAMWNGGGAVQVTELVALDNDTRAKVFDILIARYVEPKSHPNSK